MSHEDILAALSRPIDAATTLDEKLARGVDAVGHIEEMVAREFAAGDEARESPHLQTEVSANTDQWSDEVTWTAPDDGVITSLLAWHVPNSEDALKTRPVVLTENNERRDIPEYPDDGEQFITGEPDDRPYQVSEPIREGEQVVIEAANSNGSYAYRFAVVPTVDYSMAPDGGGA